MRRFLLLALVLLVGCSRGDKSGTKPLIDEPSSCGRLLVVTTDFTSGSVAVLDADSTLAVRSDLQAIHADAAARAHGGLVYVVNRLGGDNIQVLDPAQDFRTVRQFSVGIGSNPHDIAFVAPDRAYVSRNAAASLLEIDPRSGAIRDSVDLSPLADADGVPDMDRLYFQDPYLYVAVQRIDFNSPLYPPVPPSYLAVVDTRDNTLVDVDFISDEIEGIVLQGLNPCAPMVWDEDDAVLLVPEVGVYGSLDGGIEKVDLARRRSVGWLVREEDLGGDLIDFAITSDGRGFATVSGPTFATSLVAFDPATGARGATLYASNAYDLADLAVTPCGYLFVCDRKYEASGLRVFHADTGLPVAGVEQPISTGLPPFELLFLEGTIQGGASP